MSDRDPRGPMPGPRRRSGEAGIVRIVQMFEGFGPDDVARLGEYYHPAARFKDPFNDVQGVPAIQAVFRHMFATLDEPRFIVHDVLVQDGQCMLTWDMVFRMRRFDTREQSIRGATHLRVDGAGLIVLHRDYWDAAEELYEKLPLVGALMRWLKRRVNG